MEDINPEMMSWESSWVESSESGQDQIRDDYRRNKD